ncbi:TIGR03943 family protein [Nocardiopsis sp. ATB16-24]|uniref:TIGR03943 family putative permease subunit n=1 Tax=Nocardiopsis sp. ATB16-24 TaxID=3019555 RepID=UPI0025547900|nr:TIGR03943 family protein [Nocardiopsis sp. ATB16-24]
MNRMAQGLTLVLLGAAALTSTVATDLYLNWVKPGFGPFLIAAGVAMAVLGVLVIVAELRETRQEPEAEGVEHHGHDHSRAPGVAWLLLLPVVAVFVVAPPALGAYTVETTAGASGPPPDQPRSGRFDDGLVDAEPGEVVPMHIRQFVMRAWIDEERLLAGREVELTGFAVPTADGQGWYLARLQMACCAADAVVNKVVISGAPAPEADTWWRVRGRWIEPEGELSDVSEHGFEVVEMEEVTDPPDPYE